YPDGVARMTNEKGICVMRARIWMLCMVAALAAAGCGRDDAPPAAGAGPEQGPVVADPGQEQATDAIDPQAPPTLQDVIEHDPRYVVGISYPPAAREYPGLAVELDAFA